MSNLGDVSTDDLVADLFGGEVESARDPEQIRAEVLRRIDEIIGIIKPLDVEWQRLMQAAFGTMTWGGMVIRGANDKDGCERWRNVREIYAEMDHEDLLTVEFE